MRLGEERAKRLRELRALLRKAEDAPDLDAMGRACLQLSDEAFTNWRWVKKQTKRELVAA